MKRTRVSKMISMFLAFALVIACPVPVSAAQYDQEQDFVSWFRELTGDMAGQQDDGICITAIMRSDMSTARILELLSSEDSVVFAEPNYIMGVGSEDGAAGTEAMMSVPDLSSAGAPEIEAADHEAGGSACLQGNVQLWCVTMTLHPARAILWDT